MAKASGKPDTVAPAAIVIAVVLLLAPGGFFVAKGGLELADRVAGRDVREATLESLETREHIANGRTQTRYLVGGTFAEGGAFEFDDRRVYDLAIGRIPLSVRVDVSQLTGRIINLRTDTATIERVGGASLLSLAVLGLVLGGAIAATAFRLPWQTKARKRAVTREEPSPPPDWRALAIMTISAVVIVGGTIAWDLR